MQTGKLHIPLIVIFMLILPFRLAAQIEVNGTVSNEEGEPVEFVNIFNKQTQEGTTTNTLGYYKIKAFPGDTISFSFVGFIPYTVVVPNDTLKNNISFLIELSYQTKILRTIEVIGYRERPKTVLERTDNKNRTPIKVLPSGINPNPSVGKIADGYYIDNGVFMMPGPFTMLHELLGSHARQRRKIARLDARIAEMNPEEEINPLNPEWVSELTGYEGDRLKDFMKYCFPSDEYIARVSEYELAKYVLQVYKEYDRTIWSSQN
jgi:hypothetical protein